MQFNPLKIRKGVTRAIPAKLVINSFTRYNVFLCGFRTCGICPIDPEVAYKRLPTEGENIKNPRKQPDDSLHEMLHDMIYGDRDEVEPGKSVVIPESDSESEIEPDSSDSEPAISESEVEEGEK